LVTVAEAMNGRVAAFPRKLKSPEESVDPERLTVPHGPVMVAETTKLGPGFTDAIGVTRPEELVEPDQTIRRVPGAGGLLVQVTSLEKSDSSEPATDVTAKK